MGKGQSVQGLIHGLLRQVSSVDTVRNQAVVPLGVRQDEVRAGDANPIDADGGTGSFTIRIRAVNGTQVAPLTEGMDDNAAIKTSTYDQVLGGGDSHGYHRIIVAIEGMDRGSAHGRHFSLN